jgi:uncharacterized protein (TIGR00288 family)
MSAARKVMLLVDADNVSVDVIQQAFDRVMTVHGAAHVRRAYCTAESALKHLQLFKRLSMRPIVNVSTGKNSTDIALAVDAISLVEAERPDVVVIVSSDSDFAPLVIRLREKGCRVEGIGQKGKTGEDSVGVYDDFVDMTHRKAPGRAPADSPRAQAESARAPAPRSRAPANAPRAPVEDPVRAPARAPSRGRASARAVAAPVAVVEAVPAPVAAPVAAPPAPAAKRRGRAGLRSEATAAPAPAPAPTPQAPPLPPVDPSLPEDVRQILEAVPELRDGGKVELGIAAERLRSANLLARSATSTKLFKKHLDFFVLTPERQPNKVQYRGPQRG